MKTKQLIILCLLTSSVLIAQVPKGTVSLENPDFSRYFMNADNIPIVKGKILNFSSDDSVKITYSLVSHFDRYFQVKKTTNIKSDGTFELQLDHAFPLQQIFLRVNPLFIAAIYANSDLYIELDANKMKNGKWVEWNGEGVKYLGTDGELNNYMNNHILFKRKQQIDLSKAISALRLNRNLSYEDFRIQYDELYSKLHALDNEYIKENPSRYSWIIKNERMSRYLNVLCIKHWGKVMDKELWEIVRNHKSYLVSNDGAYFYYTLFQYLLVLANRNLHIDWTEIGKYSGTTEIGKNIIDSINYYQKTIKKNEPYDTISYRSLEHRANATFSDTIKVIWNLKTIALLDSIFIAPKADFLKMKIISNELKLQKLLLELVLKNISTDWCKNVLNIEYQKTLEKVNSVDSILNQSKTLSSDNNYGQAIEEMPFGAKLYKIDKIKASEFLGNLKNAFKGKALLVDFWATWCAPCIQEMPYSKKLHDDTKDMPVEFVYLCTSTGSSIDKWKSKIAELKVPGTHIFVDETIETELMNLFSKSAFPSYVFIDTNGTYKPGAIERPSVTDINKLKELINRK